MSQHRVLLLSAHPLLSEGLANVLGTIEDVVLIGPRAASGCTLADVRASAPDVVLFAAQEIDDSAASALLVQILQHVPDLPVIQVGLAQSTAIHVYTSRVLPARSANLIETIRRLSLQSTDDAAQDDDR